MKFYPVAAALAVLITLGACGESGDKETTASWPQEFRDEFMNGCMSEGGEKALCDCVLADMEKNVSLSELMVAGIQMEANDAASDEFTNKVVESSVRCAMQTMDK